MHTAKDCVIECDGFMAAEAEHAEYVEYNEGFDEGFEKGILECLRGMVQDPGFKWWLYLYPKLWKLVANFLQMPYKHDFNALPEELGWIDPDLVFFSNFFADLVGVDGFKEQVLDQVKTAGMLEEIWTVILEADFFSKEKGKEEKYQKVIDFLMPILNLYYLESCPDKFDFYQDRLRKAAISFNNWVEEQSRYYGRDMGEILVKFALQLLTKDLNKHFETSGNLLVVFFRNWGWKVRLNAPLKNKEQVKLDHFLEMSSLNGRFTTYREELNNYLRSFISSSQLFLLREAEEWLRFYKIEKQDRRRNVFLKYIFSLFN